MKTQPPPLRSQSTEPTSNTPSAHFIDAYQWGKIIGQGTQGNVYSAVRMADHKKVVIKQINIHSIHNWKDYDLFRREAQVLESLDIPGVARFYEAIECLDDDPPCAYIVQEYIPGKNLAQLIKNGHRFTLNAIYDIIIQTLKIIDQLHRHDPPIIHRDIKPSNIMLSPDGKVTIIDFGAVANPQVQGGGSTVAGTIGFMPPEQLMGKPVPASDIYALGAVAIQLITGTHPADIPTQDFYLIFEPIMQDKPHALVQLLRRMLEPKAEQRLSDIPEIVRQIEHLKNPIDNQADAPSADKLVVSNNKYTQSYEERLAAVESICQTGNVEIWQQLPENTPRPFPDIYRQFVDIKPSDIDDAPIPGLNSDKVLLSVSKTNDYKETQWFLLYASTLSSIFTAILFFVLHKTSVFPFKTSSGTLTLVVVSLFCFFFIIIICFYAWGGFLPLYSDVIEPLLKKKNRNNVNFDHLRSSETTRNLSSRDLIHLPCDVRKLFYNGRKTIATIVDIQYIECSQRDVMINEKDQIHYVCIPTPCFKVSYSFNPPDDKRQDNIVHSFLTDIEPENHYKMGGTLPILYSIDKMNGYDMVTSMPFPLPMIDFKYFMHIIDRSFSNFDFNKEIHDFTLTDENTGSSHYSTAQKHIKSSFSNITEILIKINTYDINTLLGYKEILDDCDLYPIHHIYLNQLIHLQFLTIINDQNTTDKAYKLVIAYLAKTPRTQTQPTSLAVSVICNKIYYFKEGKPKENISELLVAIFKDKNTSHEVKEVLRAYGNYISMPESFKNAISR